MPYKLFAILVIILIILVNLTPPPKPQPHIPNSRKVVLYIFTKEGCGMCEEYKKNHDKIVRELKTRNPNLEVEMVDIEDREKMVLYGIKFFPSFVVVGGGKMEKLTINTFPTTENLQKLIDTLYLKK